MMKAERAWKVQHSLLVLKTEDGKKKKKKINKVEQPTPEETGISWIEETV